MQMAEVAEAPRKRRRPKLKSKEEQALRGEMILARKLAGERVADIARDFGITRQTAYKSIEQAKREGIFEGARDFISLRLLPKALAVYDQALDEMDVEVARDVLQGLGLTGRTLKVEQKHTVSEDFDAWRLKKAQAIEARSVVEVVSAGSGDAPEDSTGTAIAGDVIPEDEVPAGT